MSGERISTSIVNNITWTGQHKLYQSEYKYDLNMNLGINCEYVVTEHGKMKGPKAEEIKIKSLSSDKYIRYLIIYIRNPIRKVPN